MRDLDQWKDKVEVTLDGRQLFFLFFGGAVITSMMFCLGVMTGRRLEARALALQPPTIDDPLAALDQLGDVEEEGLTFHHSLTHNNSGGGGKASTGGNNKASAPAANPAAAGPANANAGANANASASAPTPSVAAPPVVAAAPAAPAAKPTPAKAPPAAAAATPTPVPPSVPGHFTLQLSAFAEKADADAFVKRMQSGGYKPFIVASEIPGKGIFYRVRLGDYTNRESATNAKEELEKKQNVVAYVTKL